MIHTQHLIIAVSDVATVSGCLIAPAKPLALFVLTHGAGMYHPFMAAVASGRAERGIAILRYQFPFMEAGSRRPHCPSVALAKVWAAVAAAVRLQPRVPLLAGGKSFGARMTTQARAEHAVPSLLGLIALGFPLHQAGKPPVDRTRHVADINLPMLFLQGDRDAMADPELITAVVAASGSRTTSHLLAGAGHSFHVLARSGRTDAQVLAEALDVTAGWVRTIITGAKAAG